MRFLFKFLSLLSFCFVISCGKSDTGAGKGQGPIEGSFTQNETIMVDGSNIKGIYSADLFPINNNLQLKKVGVAAVKRKGDIFTVKVKIKYGQIDTVLKQAIYTGRRCPDINDDLNKDAFIDIQEALIAIGKITIPLDSNIESQQAGLDEYPIGDAVSGGYFYKMNTSFSKMFADLKNSDEDPYDNIVKLKKKGGLTFPGRVVLLQGLHESIFLPDTAATTENESKHTTIPIACGVLWKVNKFPKEIQEGR